MKKRLLLILTLIIYFSVYPSVWASCLIKNKPAPALSEYIKNNRTIIKNITNSIVKAKNKKTSSTKDSNQSSYSKFKKEKWEEFDKTAAETSSIFNEIFNFTWYYSYFKYYVTYPISNEVPSQVKRDYKLIDNENKWLTQYLKQINQNWDSDIIIENACKWVTRWLEKCKVELNNKKSIKIIWKLIKNNDLILDLYRNSIIWSDDDYSIEDFIIVDENFIEQIQFEYYSQIAVSECNQEKWWFFEQITSAIGDIKLINKAWEDWIKKWQDAFALLLWSWPDWEEAKVEQKQLKKYLSDSWIPGEKQDIIMKNLAETNSKWFSFNNSFIENTFDSTKKKLKKDLAIWKKQYIWDALPKNTQTTSINLIKKITNNSEVTRNIEKNIDELYESELPYIWVGNITTETLRSKIINSHFNIQDSIWVLENTIKISSKVCKSQWGWWKCD